MGRICLKDVGFSQFVLELESIVKMFFFDVKMFFFLYRHQRDML